MDDTPQPIPNVKQTPPDIAFAIKNGGTTLIKMVGVGGTTIGRYTSGMEYWYSGALTTALLDVSSLTLEYQAMPATATGIDNYFGGMTQRFAPPRTDPLWAAGAHAHANVTTYLFSMDDPDATTRLPRNKVGVLIEVDSSPNLVGVVFYKLTSGQIWDKAGPTTPVDWTLNRVKTPAGAYSTDPNDIPKSWLSTVMGA